MYRISEQDEFLLSQLLDGTLEPDAAAALQERIEHEPDLRAAYQSLRRLDAALVTRRSAVPEIDWAGFRHELMSQVRQQPSAERRVIPFPRLRWLVAPMAAAAAIVLAVLLLPTLNQQPQEDRSRPPLVARHEEQPKPAPQPDAKPVQDRTPTQLVRYSRPQSRSSGVIRVSYTQSDRLATAMRERDKMYRGRPSWHMYVAVNRPVQPNAVTEELPPL